MQKLKKLILCFIISILLTISAYGGWNFYLNATYITMDHVRYPRSTQELDLSGSPDPNVIALTQFENLKKLDLRGTGITVDEYDLLHAALPECIILWDIPFQGKFWDISTRQLKITSLTEEDMRALAYLPALQQIDARSFYDHEAISRLKQQYPDCRILYNVTVNGADYPDTTQLLTVEDADIRELEFALSVLPQLRGLHLTGQLPDITWLEKIQAQYPHLNVTWDYLLYGQLIPNSQSEIDLSGTILESTEEVEAFLPYFPKLNKLILCDCGLSSGELDALNRRYESIRIVWSIRIGRCVIRTDATTFMPFKWGYTPGHPLIGYSYDELKYCTDMICIDMGHMMISDCSFVSSMPNLEYLLLADTQISDLTPLKDLKKLKYLELFGTSVRDISPLAGCTALEDINLCYLYLSGQEVLCELPNLKHIWLVGTYFPRTALEKLREHHPDAVICTESGGSSTGYGWRETENYYRQRDLLEMRYMTG